MKTYGIFMKNDDVATPNEIRHLARCDPETSDLFVALSRATLIRALMKPLIVV